MNYLKTYIGLTVLLLAIYITTLNFAVSETFRRGQTEKDLRVLRQDLQEQEASFATQLSSFYDQYSGAFVASNVTKQEFVSRQENVAVSPGLNLR